MFGGTIRIGFWPYQQTSGNPHLEFFGGFGGIMCGCANTWGTAWLNYDLNTLRKWDANFQANFVGIATNVNLWGMRGEVVGNIATGGIGVVAGVVGGKGHFR
jgi:hypothetical protein